MIVQRDESSLRLRRLGRTTALGFVLRGGSVVAALASQLLLARCMALDAFGLYVTVMAWVTVLSLAAGAGMPLSAIRFLAAYRVRRDWASFRGFLRRALALTLASSVVVTAGFGALWSATPSFHSGVSAALVGSPLLLLMGLTGLASAVLQAMQHPLIADSIPNLAVRRSLRLWSGLHQSSSVLQARRLLLP